MREFQQVVRRQIGSRIAFPQMKPDQWRRNEVRGIPALFRCSCGGSCALSADEIDGSGCTYCFNCRQPMKLVGFVIEQRSPWDG